jgi:hypothetical protein
MTFHTSSGVCRLPQMESAAAISSRPACVVISDIIACHVL